MLKGFSQNNAKVISHESCYQSGCKNKLGDLQEPQCKKEFAEMQLNSSYVVGR